jgi:CheY-like chemotaxis protein
MQAHPIILILEDCLVTAVTLERTILTHLPACRPIIARNLQEARLRATGISVDIFILDVVVPDGSGLDFLWEMATVQPQAQAIVITSNPLPEYQVQSAALGALQFLEKPVSSQVFLQFLTQAFAATNTSQAFHATLMDLTPLDIIQLKCLSGATTAMEFASGGRLGQLYFRGGNIVHAELEGEVGVTALREIFSWSKGTAREFPPEPEVETTIKGSWQSLVMEVAQAVDERR